jgi:hypothetical protein
METTSYPPGLKRKHLSVPAWNKTIMYKVGLIIGGD